MEAGRIFSLSSFVRNATSWGLRTGLWRRRPEMKDVIASTMKLGYCQILPRNTITIQRESSKKNKSGRAKPLAPSPSIGMLRCTMDGEAQRWSLHPQSANGGGIPCTMADPPFPAQTTTIPFLNCLPSSSTIYYPCPPHSVFTLAWQEVFPNRK